MTFGPWTDESRCGDGKVDMFPAPDDAEGIATAVALCRGCDVRRSCLIAGQEEDFGVWGGVLRTTQAAWSAATGGGEPAPKPAKTTSPRAPRGAGPVLMVCGREELP